MLILKFNSMWISSELIFGKPTSMFFFLLKEGFPIFKFSVSSKEQMHFKETYLLIGQVDTHL